MGTLLEENGCDISGDLWGAQLIACEPEAIVKAHRQYIEAGSDIIITSSYQASVSGIRKVLGVDRSEAERLIRSSVELACRARGESKSSDHVVVAASMGCYGACLADGSEYNPKYASTMSVEALVDWHRPRFELVLQASPPPDLLAFETIPSRREAQAIVKLPRSRPETKAWVCFTCRSERELTSGETLVDCIHDIEEADKDGQVQAVGVNCTSPHLITPLIKLMRAETKRRLVVYPNSGETWDSDAGQWLSCCDHDHDGDGHGDHDGDGHGMGELGSLVHEWMQAGAELIGGCCRTGPKHIRTIANAINRGKTLKRKIPEE